MHPKEQLIKQMLEKGKSRRYIAEKLNVSSKTISKIKQEYNIEGKYPMYIVIRIPDIVGALRYLFEKYKELAEFVLESGYTLDYVGETDTEPNYCNYHIKAINCKYSIDFFNNLFDKLRNDNHFFRKTKNYNHKIECFIRKTDKYLENNRKRLDRYFNPKLQEQVALQRKVQELIRARQEHKDILIGMKQSGLDNVETNVVYKKVSQELVEIQVKLNELTDNKTPKLVDKYD